MRIRYDTPYHFNLEHCCCLDDESSVFCIALSCAVKKYAYRPVPSGKIILNIYTAAAAAAPADRARRRQPAASSL